MRPVLLAPAFLVACTSSSPATEPPCVQGLSTSCAATYDPPTFATIHAKILKPSCATGQGTCHTSDAAKAGLVLSEEGPAYDALKARITGSDVSCSLLQKRLHSTDPNYRMPPGSESLPAGDLCTITKWIAAGAPR